MVEDILLMADEQQSNPLGGGIHSLQVNRMGAWIPKRMANRRTWTLSTTRARKYSQLWNDGAETERWKNTWKISFDTSAAQMAVPSQDHTWK